VRAWMESEAPCSSIEMRRRSANWSYWVLAAWSASFFVFLPAWVRMLRSLNLRNSSSLVRQSWRKISLRRFYLSGTLYSNYPEFPDSCLKAQFFLLIEVFEVLIDGADISVEEFTHQSL